MLEIALTVATVALTGVTGLAAYPYEVRARHAKMARARAIAAWEWTRLKAWLAGDRIVFHTVRLVTLTSRVVNHRRVWIMLQVTMVLPERVRRRDRS